MDSPAIPLTPERLVYDLKTATQPALSPDGTRVAFVVSHQERGKDKPTSQIWISDLDGGNQRQLTSEDATHASPTWSPRADAIAYVATFADHSKIYVRELERHEPDLVTHHLATPANLAWSPDGDALAYSVAVDPANPEEFAPVKDALLPVRVVRRADYKLDGRGYLGDIHNQIFVATIAEATRRQLTDDTVDHGTIRWSADGTTIGAIQVDRQKFRQRVTLIDVASSTARIVGGANEQVRFWQWDGDGSTDRLILFVSEHYSVAGRFVLETVADGSRRELTTAETWDYALEYGDGAAWLDATRLIVGGHDRAASGLWILDTGSTSIERVALGDVHEDGVVAVPGKPYVVRTWSGSEGTGELVVHNVDTKTVTRLTHLNDAWFAATRPATVERMSATSDEFEVEFLLTKPVDFDPETRYPVVAFVHGGPHGFHGFAYTDSAQLLASEGYVVVSPNPRGSTSYGSTFAAGCLGDWGGGDWRDIVASLDKALELPFVDRERTAIYGYSYGGYMSSWAIGQTTRFKAAVIGAPITDLISRFGTSDIGYPIGNIEYNGEFPELHDWAVRQSPITHVHKATTPTLILHPEEDHRCPIGQGEQLFTGLLKANVETEFVRYPGQSHLMPWSGPASYRVDFHTRVLDWMKRHL